MEIELLYGHDGLTVDLPDDLGITVIRKHAMPVLEDPVQGVRQALENMKQILAAAGCGLDDVLTVDVFLTDMKLFARFNAIYESFFGDHRPARAVVALAGLPKEALVEIKCISKRE